MRNSIKSLFETYLVSLLSLLSSFIIAQFLRPDMMGQFGVYLALIAFGNILIEGGLQSYIVYSQDLLKRRIALQSVSIWLALFLFLLSVIFIKFNNLPGIALLACAVSLMSIALISIPTALLVKNNNYLTLMRINGVPTTLGLVYIILSVYILNRKGVNILYEQSILVAIMQLVLLKYYKLHIPVAIRLDRYEIVTAYKYSYKIFIQGFQDRVANQGIYLVLGSHMQNALGHFLNASKTHQFGVKKSVLGISRVFFTSLTIADDYDKEVKLSLGFKRLILVLPLALLLLNIAIEVFFRLLPDYWDKAKIYSHLLSLDILFYPHLVAIQNYVNAKGQTHLSFYINSFRFSIILLSWLVVIFTDDFVWYIIAYVASGFIASTYGLRFVPKRAIKIALFSWPILTVIIVLFWQIIY